MEEKYVTDKQEASSLVQPVATSQKNHHPRKLPNIPRNPEIYEPSPGIFKYIRKDNKITVSSPSSASRKDKTHDSLASSSTNVFESVATSKPSTFSYTDTESEEMLMELECYDEATHNASMVQQVEPVPALASSHPRLSGNLPKPGTKPTSCGTYPARTGANVSNLRYKPPNLNYQPPKLGDHVHHASPQPNNTTLLLDSDAKEIQQCVPTEFDEFDALKAKLNRAMQLYTLQRRQIVKLSGRVKNLSRTNERLTERARLANSGSKGVNRPSPCLATDTKYVILFENLINPEAMNTITSAMSTSEKPTG